jgi:hypothetical protein
LESLTSFSRTDGKGIDNSPQTFFAGRQAAQVRNGFAGSDLHGAYSIITSIPKSVSLHPIYSGHTCLQGDDVNAKLKFLALGFVLGIASTFGAVFGFLLAGSDSNMTVHETKLPSGKMVKVTMCNLVWGVGHDESERDAGLDQFELDLVSSMPGADLQARAQEVWEAFELIRPVSEQWGLRKATISAFPSTRRKGPYDIYAFQRGADGKWTVDRHQAKVHIND